MVSMKVIYKMGEGRELINVMQTNPSLDQVKNKCG